VKRALLKGSGLFLMGLLPRGVHLYRRLTREIMGTQASHITKLHRVWPGYVEVICNTLGGPLEGRRIWVHESGWTPFLVCVNYLTCGNGGVLTNTRLTNARMLDRYTVESINKALALAPTLRKFTPIPEHRIRQIDALRWRENIDEVLSATGATYLEGAPHDALPLESDSVDIVYSGGQLEHYRPCDLRAFLAEAFRILKPGGIIAPVLDHRDHLFHYDKALPFLYHYSLSELVYRLTHFSPLLYHNRLLPSEVSRMFEEAGFERIKILRLSLPGGRWFDEGEPVEGEFGIERSKLAKRFRNASDDDLKTAAAHYIFRKPAMASQPNV